MGIFNFFTKRKERELNTEKLNTVNKYLDCIENCVTLYDLFNLHKDAWFDGVQNENLGVCRYGMIRAESMETLTPNEVFLGGIYGLFTYELPFWASCNDEGAKKIVFKQYYNLLFSNFKAIKKDLEMSNNN